jgi:transposase
MKLLPYVIPFIKDAARAVKRICQKDFKAVLDETLTELLGIATLVVTMYAMRREGEHEVLHLWCAHRKEIARCTHCGALSTSVHDEEHRCIRHLDVWGKKTFLHFMNRRFRCEECNRVFAEQLPFVDPHRRQSTAFERHIYDSCLGSTCKAVSVRQGLSQRTTRQIFNRWTAALKGKVHKAGTIRVVGIDEISLKKRHRQFALIISDLDRKCILAVLPDREKKTLEAWIDTLSPEDRASIRFVSIDMWAPYYQAAQTKLPHAKVVVDRFHVMKQLNTRLTQLRTAYQKGLSPEMRSQIKGSRWLLVRNRAALSASEEAQLAQLLNLCPDLRTLYLLKEEFRNIFEKAHDRQQAQRFFSAWILKATWSGNKYLAKFVITLRNWWEEILNYFLERITNGFVEALNGVLRAMMRTAFGYRNFHNFRLRAFAESSVFHTNLR